MTNQQRTWLGVILIVVGFFGHFFAARAIGGTYIAYRDHMAGFFGLLVITGAIIALLGRRFWKGRQDITLLIIGVVQALFGIYIYIERFNIGRMTH
jgi:FtsH-binding integral membrane protein